MAVFITASVGKNGKNQISDVVNMQLMLNNFIFAGHLKPHKALVPDGVVGKLTIGAIKAFQHSYLGFSFPDGRIDPGGQTLAKLNGPIVPPPFGSKPGTGIGSGLGEKTHEWAIALRAIHFGSAEFGLVNRVTEEIRTIVIKNSSISAVAVGKSFKERWVSFKTFMDISFNDFNGKSTSFSRGAPGTDTHTLSLGYATIPVAILPTTSFTQLCPVEIPRSIWGPALASVMGCELVDSKPKHWGMVNVLLGGVSNVKPPQKELILTGFAKVLLLTP